MATLLAGAVVSAVLWLATRPADTRLWESIWELDSAAVEGEPLDIATNGEPVSWWFHRTCESGVGSGPGCGRRSTLWARGGCGTIESTVAYHDATVRWDGDARAIAPSCVGEITSAVIAVGGSGSFSYSFDDGRLVVTAPDGSAELVFRSISSVGWGD